MRLLRQEYDTLLAQYDALLMPTATMVAQKFPEEGMSLKGRGGGGYHYSSGMVTNLILPTKIYRLTNIVNPISEITPRKIRSS